MGKNTRGNKEFTREQKLSKENKQLKKELAHLRKQIARLNLESLEADKQIFFDQEERDRLNDSFGDPNSNIEDLKKIWECNECRSGFLEITLYSKVGQTWYYRKCNECEKRTKGKRYDKESVRGIIKNA